MKITIMFHDKAPFCPEPRTFRSFEYDGDTIHQVLSLLGDRGLDIYVYPHGTTLDNYKAREPMAYMVHRKQGYSVFNTLAWRRFYESNSQK